MKLVMVLMLVALPLYCYAGSGCSVLEKVVEDTINPNLSKDEYVASLQEFIDSEDTAKAAREFKQCFLSQSNETLDNFRVMMVRLFRQVYPMQELGTTEVMGGERGGQLKAQSKITMRQPLSALPVTLALCCYKSIISNQSSTSPVEYPSELGELIIREGDGARQWESSRKRLRRQKCRRQQKRLRRCRASGLYGNSARRACPPSCEGSRCLPSGCEQSGSQNCFTGKGWTCRFRGRLGGSAQPKAPASASCGVLGSVGMNPTVIVVHGGGASNISKDRKERVRQGIVRAATAGYNILKEGGSAVDAVEGAVTVLEDDPEFNAGAVSAVRCVANPIKLARLVMEKVYVTKAPFPRGTVTAICQ
ncbi:hypothetical protein CB1_000089026 [Camelus ferus]|nr:hypothetical protein CB1_000089026 [Camelus ferus]